MAVYDSLAVCYDALNRDVDYDGYVKLIKSELAKNGIKKGDLVLDLACGTGNITLRLKKLGFDMTGVDISDGMLNAAREKKGGSKILWLCQDMRDFELYGTVKAVVCCLDSVNYLTKKEDLKKCFSLVHNYLEPGGIFIFDVNSKYKFENIYGENDYILEADGIYCGWKNNYNEKTKNCDFELAIFCETGNGIRRYDEYQREHYWSDRILCSVLSECGFANTEIVADFERAPVGCESERHIFITECIK